jgi:Tryptophan halogenase
VDKKRIAVIGAGTAGILAVCHTLRYLTEYQIILIHNLEERIIESGQAGQYAFKEILSMGLKFNHVTDMQELGATYNIGTVFKNWRDHDIFVPFCGGLGLSMHFNNAKLRDFAFKRIEKLYVDRFSIMEEHCTDVYTSGELAVAVCGGKEIEFDYVIDCRDSTTDYSDCTMSDLPINHGIIHNKSGVANWMYTSHVATENGWMFEIPLTDSTSYGYMFDDRITSVDDAIIDLSERIGVPVADLALDEFEFRPFYTNTLIDGRIIKNGNRALFFEPMFADSMVMYDNNNRAAYDYIKKISTAEDCNKEFLKNIIKVEEQIAYFYYGGTQYESEFWTRAARVSKNKLDNSENYQNMISKYKEHIGVGRSVSEYPGLYPQLTIIPHLQLCLDKQLGYNHV